MPHRDCPVLYLGQHSMRGQPPAPPFTPAVAVLPRSSKPSQSNDKGASRIAASVSATARAAARACAAEARSTADEAVAEARIPSLLQRKGTTFHFLERSGGIAIKNGATGANQESGCRSPSVPRKNKQRPLRVSSPREGINAGEAKELEAAGVREVDALPSARRASLARTPRPSAHNDGMARVCVLCPRSKFRWRGSPPLFSGTETPGVGVGAGPADSRRPGGREAPRLRGLARSRQREDRAPPLSAAVARPQATAAGRTTRRRCRSVASEGQGYVGRDGCRRGAKVAVGRGRCRETAGQPPVRPR